MAAFLSFSWEFSCKQNKELCLKKQLQKRKQTEKAGSDQQN